MYIQRLLYGKYSKIIISIILGLGLAIFFRKACNGKNCYNFLAPNMKTVKNNIYEYDGKYFKFEPHAKKCDNSKKILNFA